MFSWFKAQLGLTIGVLLILMFSIARGSEAVQGKMPVQTIAAAQSELAMAAELQETAQTKWAEWLGPLAPIAISPFFGITCLAGLAQFGGDYLPANRLLQNSSLLNNPTVFWVFAGLTLVTSLPRLTKLSKPAAQAIDLLETYAGIITLLTIRFLEPASDLPLDGSAAQIAGSTLMVQMGFFQGSSDILFGVAAAVNILVINGVKFFVEVLVWLIPVPTIDAILEGINKTICCGLMAVYAFHPFLAMLLNLAVFGVCLTCFVRISRRTRQMRTLIADPLWSMISRTYGTFRGQPLVVFNQTAWEGMPRFSKLLLRPAPGGWEVHGSRWWLFRQVVKLHSQEFTLGLHEGLIVNTIVIEGGKPGQFTFSKRYLQQTQSLCQHFNFTPSSQTRSGSEASKFEPEFS